MAYCIRAIGQVIMIAGLAIEAAGMVAMGHPRLRRWITWPFEFQAIGFIMFFAGVAIMVAGVWLAE